MRLPLLFSLGGLALLLFPATARAQAAAETALTTAATSATAGAATSKIHMPAITLPGTATHTTTVHRYARRSGTATATHHVPAKKARKAGQEATNHPPRVTYRRIQ